MKRKKNLGSHTGCSNIKNWVILEVPPDTGKIDDHFDSKVLQKGLGANSGQLQDLGRMASSSCHNNLFFGGHSSDWAVFAGGEL